MKKIYQKLVLGAAACLSLGMTSCTDYLDKQADTDVQPETAFKNFNNFQGFVEEIYNCIPDKEKCYWTVSFNWGDDEIMNTGLGDDHLEHQIDLGNFRSWEYNGQSWLKRASEDPTTTNKFNHSLWGHAWYCIRKANIGLANLDKFVGTQEEKDLIAGQLYFFRAWWYEEVMQYWGGMPYLKHPIATDEKMDYPRLSFQECADSCAEDFRKAADLLPINWDNTVVGKSKTGGHNDLRLNKVMALGYLGKVLLWAASPLNEHGAEADGHDTYNYNKDYAKKAAEAFGELLSLVESGKTQYSLAEFKYDDIYNHVKSSDAKSCFSDIFYTTGQNWKMPGTTEAIFRGPSTDYNGSNWNFTKTWGTKVNSIVEHDNVIHMPTANYVNYYGMANGLPLDDPDSGFDPSHPFKGRDPRFYHDIVFDGFKYINSSVSVDADKPYQYCQLYTGGNIRNDASGSRTGYYTQKLVPHTANKYDGVYNWNGSLHTYLPYMRLADIYLMYAEACAAVDGAKGKASNFAKTAEDAINTLRDRVEAGHVAEKFLSDNKKFMDEVRRERAVELAFEGFRFCDLQRWLLLSVAPYNQKTSQEFKRVESNDWYKNNDPADAAVVGWSEKTILTRNFGTKHYLFPLSDKDVYLYKELNQNPGW